MSTTITDASAQQNGITTTRQNVDSFPALNAQGFPFRVLHGLRVADSVDRIVSIISLSLCRPGADDLVNHPEPIRLFRCELVIFRLQQPAQ